MQYNTGYNTYASPNNMVMGRNIPQPGSTPHTVMRRPVPIRTIYAQKTTPVLYVCQ